MRMRLEIPFKFYVASNYFFKIPYRCYPMVLRDNSLKLYNLESEYFFRPICKEYVKQKVIYLFYHEFED